MLLAFIVHQLKRGYALNLNISVSAAQQKKLTRIPSVTASEVGNTMRVTLVSCSYKPVNRIHASLIR